MELLSQKTDAHSMGINWGINSVAFSPDGTKIVSACNGGTIKVWNFGTSEPSNLLGQN